MKQNTFVHCHEVFWLQFSDFYKILPVFPLDDFGSSPGQSTEETFVFAYCRDFTIQPTY